MLDLFYLGKTRMDCNWPTDPTINCNVHLPAVVKLFKFECIFLFVKNWLEFKNMGAL